MSHRHAARRPLSLAIGCLVLAGAVAQSAAAQSGPRQVESVLTSAGPIAVQQLATGLNHPWGMAFLPDGRLLVTERAGQLRILNQDHELSEPIDGVPQVWARGQGGLLDVAIDPEFQENRYVYLSYSKPGPDGKATTALGRGRFNDNRIEGFEDIFVEQPYIDGPNHFGGRVVFGEDGKLFLTLGERFQFEPAQDLSSHLGSIIRIMHDGSVPDDNPFVNQANALPEIWSYGHRNIQAAAIDPTTQQLWIVEMGPLGGDELNLIEKGANYGWPIVSWGMDYDGTDRPDPPTRPEFKDAVKHWSPVISPSGMLFYTGDIFGAWKGSALFGGLSGHELVRLKLQDGKVTNEERIPLPERIRDVEQGPDGMLYVLTDQENGDIWRIVPLNRGNG